MTYAEYGYEIVRGLVLGAWCDQINRDAAVFSSEPHISMVHTVLPFVREMMKVWEIVERSKEFIGGEVSAVNSEYFFGRPGTLGFNNHQDNKYIQAPKMVSCWIALTDVDRENGCLYVYPASQGLGMLPTKPTPHNRVDECELPLLLVSIDVPLQKGDAIFMDGLLVHGSHTNISQRNRESLTIAYIPRGAPFNPGRRGRMEIPVG